MSAVPRRLRTTNIWPGFVDAMAALLMVVIFVLLVFVIAQFYLRETLLEQEGDLERLQFRIGELAEFLSLEQASNADLRDSVKQLSEELSMSIGQREQMRSEIEAARLALDTKNQDITRLNAELNQARNDLSDVRQSLEDVERQWSDAVLQARKEGENLNAVRQLTTQQKDEITVLNQQIFALRSQIETLSAHLEVVRAEDEANKVKIADLGRQLNVALAGKVQELARYRSEFFGRLRALLGDTEGIEVVGDRFVFQSEVLFESGKAFLEPTGQSQLASLAETLKQVATSIPDDINWVLRIDGHTDRVPIASARYPSNWELSTARAMSVVTYLLELGIPGKRLAVAGFGEHHPLDSELSEEANQRNRRIEIKLTQR